MEATHLMDGGDEALKVFGWRDLALLAIRIGLHDLTFMSCFRTSSNFLEKMLEVSKLHRKAAQD